MVSVYRFGEHLIPSGCVFLTTALSYAFTNRKPVVPGRILKKFQSSWQLVQLGGSGRSL